MENTLTKPVVSQSKTVMLFILAMSLSGIENLVAEIIPELQLGPIEIGISSFVFVPIILCILFNNFWVALAAPIGEIIFADLLLGEFGGLSEMEEVILLTMGLFIAGRIVRDVKNRKQIVLAVLIGFGFAELAGTLFDMAKIWIGVEELEAVAGLPESVFVLEGIDFLIDFIVTGIIFGLIPTLIFTPSLYGKLEPLLGIKPRKADDARKPFPVGLVLGALATLVLGGLAAYLSAAGTNIMEWEADFVDQFGDSFIWVAIGAAAVVAAVVSIIAVASNRKNRRYSSGKEM